MSIAAPVSPSNSPRRRPRRLAPEVVQTSAMDCGPASLKALLEGFGVHASYGRLREACQIDLDGTSIDTVEQVAAELGLAAEQVMVPLDHLLLAEARCLPGIVVVRQPGGTTHFVVAWRRHGPRGGLVQVMDPATGRRWPSARRFLESVYVHRMPVPAAGWREWAGSEDFLRPLAARLRELGLPAAEAGRRIAAATADHGWESLAALDAAARISRSVVDAGGLKRGAEAGRLLAHFLEKAPAEANDRHQAPAEAGDSPQAPAGAGNRFQAPAEAGAIPDVYWSVRPGPPGADGEAQLLLRGAVLVRVRGPREAAPGESPKHEGEPGQPPEAAPARALSPELAAALTEPPPRPWRELLRMLRAGGLLAPAALVPAVAVAALGVVFEALLFRSFFDLGGELGLADQRLSALLLLAAFAAGLLLLDLPIGLGVFALGRHLETRLRLAVLTKVPRLGDRYFHSRLTSDMAERSHSVHRLRLAPELGEWFLRSSLELAFTTAGIIWLDPESAPLALATAVLVIAVPGAMLPWITERDLRLRNHSGALARFYLDALLGLLPIRTHGAGRAVRRQHEGLLVEWARAHLGLRAAETIADGVIQVGMLAMVVVLVFDHVARRGLDGGVLLLVFWSLAVMTLGHSLTLMLATQLPSHRNVALRLLEPLGAPEEGVAGDEELAASASGERSQEGAGRFAPVGFAFERVSVRAGGHPILLEIDLAVTPGEHVAVVGPSGAGKSSLVGLLLGWHRPAAGTVRVDGEPLDPRRLPALRRATAWVDPAVQIWNRSLLENLRYGAPEEADGIERAVREADLAAVLRKLPEGLQTPLGEGGGLVSGGEGQRVRLARALLRRGAGLAILDEPFRGLDREQRRDLLARARRLWRDATLLCVTHDVGETLAFERVVVMERGRIVEDGRPEELAAAPGSRYRALLDAEEEVRRGLWASPVWRRLHMTGGRLAETSAPGNSRQELS